MSLWPPTKVKDLFGSAHCRFGLDNTSVCADWFATGRYGQSLGPFLGAGAFNYSRGDQAR